MKKMPYIAKNENGIPTLYVKEEPYLMIGCELHNSASSSLAFMEKEVWPYLKPFAVNTVIMPVAWESIEPQEGQFDFSLLQGLLDQARREEKKLVLLWFGLWKNGESFYVPEWVKADYERFYRACYSSKVPSDTVSPFCEEAVEADKKAFCRLMQFLKDYDEEENTVIMIQVENEIGFLRAERDYCEQANKVYAQEIPEEMKKLFGFEEKACGNWYEMFGEEAPETFMAYHYADAVERIASAGKRIYPLPMYTNAWLKQYPERPGSYPSGGPVYDMIPVWKEMAPSLDLLAPDIYLPDIKTECMKYSVCENPLFIPEARRDPVTASNAFYVFGGMNALGFAPFGIEDFFRDDYLQPDEKLLAELNIAVDGFNGLETGPYLQKSYEVLQGMYPLLLKYRGTKKMKAFLKSNPYERGTIIPMEGYDLAIEYLSGKTGSAGIILEEENGFFISGCNASFMPLPKRGSGQFLTIVRMEEGCFEAGVWKRNRVMNGDELGDKKLPDMAESRYMKICLHKSV